ncbi:hypothetical protein XELAEV_18013558mg [Xenopus laevis]|uniref:Uncharacterized protein n=1 Tax=Xenopus laevis TaxID=8355 RepID=A0A974HZG9_XENLA|nr:hypothetical protein XELAEV_18013558mg [Xenopus laevis]
MVNSVCNSYYPFNFPLLFRACHLYVVSATATIPYDSTIPPFVHTHKIQKTNGKDDHSPGDVFVGQG